MDQPTFLFRLLLLLLLLPNLFCLQPPLILLAQPQEGQEGRPPPLPTKHTSHHITVQGSVFCDPCHNNTFSRYSYFLPGVEVHIQCKLRANSTQDMELSVNRTTNRYGIYKLDIASVEGVACIDERPPPNNNIQAFCEASLKKGSSSSSLTCNVPGLSSTTNEITLKSKRNNQCIYSMSALSYRPHARNATICGNGNISTIPSSSSFNSSKFFFPYFPPYYTIPWPQFPPLPALPPLPQLPSFPFSPLPPLPSLPPLPPLPSLPPLPPLPSLPPFSSWPFPQVPNPRPPPSPSFTFPPFPNFPQAPPPPPSNNLGDPRTWIPHYPPSPPTIPQQQHP